MRAILAVEGFDPGPQAKLEEVTSVIGSLVLSDLIGVGGPRPLPGESAIAEERGVKMADRRGAVRIP